MNKILIVDDNPSNIRILFECLESEGFKIMVAQDGKDALEIAENIKPNIILLDIIMPDMNGYETCEALKKNEATKDIPIIFMTALTDTENKVQGFKAGAVDYICKPFQQEEVIARIKTHMTIQNQKNHLLRLNREKEKMISIIAHDLRSPFNGILGLLELLNESYESFETEERVKYIKYLKDSAEGVYIFVEELLTWIVSGKGKLDFKPDSINLKKLAESAVNISKNNASAKNITIETNIDEEYEIYADANMASAVIRNIVSNSIKFTKKEGNISITATKNNKMARIIISDTGIGMTKETIEKILDGTSLQSSNGTDNESGTGLGLLISKEFIDKNNGTMDIASTPFKGTDFIIEFPTPENN